MGRMYGARAARADDSRGDIVEALRAIPDCSVEDIGYPVDLLVGLNGVTLCVDCKTESVQFNGAGRPFRYKGRKTRAQKRFAEEHRGAPVIFASSPAEAVTKVLAAAGLRLVTAGGGA